MIRRKLLRGAHEWIGAEELMSSLMVWMLSARNISGSFKLVMRRVFEGGVGCVSAGMLDRSIDILDRLREVGLDDSGVRSGDML